MAKNILDTINDQENSSNRTINSKAKGANNERRAAKAMEAWVGLPFSRVPQSGGLRWADDHKVAGDIIPSIQSNFNFVVETKHYKKVYIKKVLGKRSICYNFFSQALRDCLRLYEQSGLQKYPLVLARENYMKSEEYYVISLSNTLDVPKIAEGSYMYKNLYQIKIFVYLYSQLTDVVTFEKYQSNIIENWNKLLYHANR